jgi:hypothetical protein
MSATPGEAKACEAEQHQRPTRSGFYAPTTGQHAARTLNQSYQFIAELRGQSLIGLLNTISFAPKAVAACSTSFSISC